VTATDIRSGNVAAETPETMTATLGFSTTSSKKLSPDNRDNRQQEIAIETFWGQSCHLSYPSLSQSLGNTFIELGMVENPEFGISMLYVS